MAYQAHVSAPGASSTGKTTQVLARVVDTESGAVRTYAVDVRHAQALGAALLKLGNGKAQS